MWQGRIKLTCFEIQEKEVCILLCVYLCLI